MSIKNRTPLLAGGVLALVLLPATPAAAMVSADIYGDEIFESVYASPDPSVYNSFWTYTDPVSGNPSPITRIDGQRINTGDVSEGQDPYASDQLQYQRYHVTGSDAPLSLTLMGGYAGYRNIIGVYTYADTADPTTATLTYKPLFTQNVHPLGTRTNFTIAAGNYFGFYVDANGGSGASEGIYYTENFRNPDNSSSRQRDHFLTFDTNQGIVLTMEDTAYNRTTRRLGDQDYNDIMIGRVTYVNGVHLLAPTGGGVPEPATLSIAILGAALVLLRRPTSA